jgi:hypothetical protein
MLQTDESRASRKADNPGVSVDMACGGVMAHRFASAADRRAAAHAAVTALDGPLSTHRKLDVRCRNSHHVAAVYEADGVLVYSATVGPHGHGSRDRVDAGHAGSTRGRGHTDLLDTAGDMMSDDGIPASCECGPRTLSRAALLASVAQGERHMIVE